MSQLYARINLDANTVTFWGPGTFLAKDSIKSLGSARWLNEKKQWEVLSDSITVQKLEELFPDIKIESENQNLNNLPNGLSVAQFIAKARFALQNEFPASFFIYGVLSGVKHYRERIYCELTEVGKSDERISCVIWNDVEKVCQSLYQAGFKLENDLQVMFEAKVNLNRKDASISLSIVSIVAEYTIAKLAAQRELTNIKLKAEGIFSQNKDKLLPFLPRRLGVLTSSGGTVINDFKASLDQSRFGFELFWISVSVQGAEAKAEIIKGLNKLALIPELDVILLFRGGGSPAELAVFNEYEIAKTICLSPLPVISAIGHQEDQSSAQDVSFLSFGVPKDIGRFFADIIINYRNSLKENSRNIKTVFAQRFDNAAQTLSSFIDKFAKLTQQILSSRWQLVDQMEKSLKPMSLSVIQRLFQRVDDLGGPIKALAGRVWQANNREYLTMFSLIIRETQHKLSFAEAKLESHENAVNEASPETQLNRGFAIVRMLNLDSIVKAGKSLTIGDEVEVQFIDIKREMIVK